MSIDEKKLPPLCVDCKYFSNRSEGEFVCIHLVALTRYVTRYEYYSCGPMRAGICGKDAKYFEAKKVSE